MTGKTYAWRSTLYPATWVPGYADEKGRFLHDFSYAGYMKGEVNIPASVGVRFVNVTDAPYNADKSGITDATLSIQQAINFVGQSGGGVVYLPEGVYKVKPQNTANAISINYSNVILRGAGTNKTFLRCDEENMRDKKVVYVGPAIGGNWDQPEDSKSYQIIRDIPKTPTQTIYISDVSTLKVGDWVIIRSDRTAEWIAEHSMGGFWTSDGLYGSTMGTTFYRQITDINTLNKTISIDIPTRYYMKTRDNARVYKVSPKIYNVGIESFSIGNKMNSVTIGWGEEDYNAKPANGGYQVHSSFLVGFSYCVNSWARNISSYQAQNLSQIHMTSNGIDLYKCRNLTIDRCDFSYPQYEGGGGNGYGFNISSQECLFTNCRSLSPRHAYSFKYAFSSGNVIYNFHSGASPTYPSDFHMYLSMSNLIDCQGLDGDMIQSSVRPYGDVVGNYHGHTSTQTVFWNTNGISYKSGINYIIESRQHQYGYIIGTKGKAIGVKTTPLTITSKYGAVDSSPEDFVEGLGLGTTLEPASLYYDQLAKRLGKDICLPVFSTANDGNMAYNVLDSNLETRWSAEGKGEYLEFCLGDEIKLVSGVKIAFFRGDIRSSHFDIWYSDNSSSWRKLQQGFESNAITNEKEEFIFTQPCLAKKIRIVGNGNSLNAWNSITEVEFLMQTATSSLENTSTSKKLFTLFPNPVSESRLTIELNTLMLNKTEISVNISDVYGKNIYSKKHVPNTNIITIDDLRLLAGIYIISIQNDKDKSTNLFFVK